VFRRAYLFAYESSCYFTFLKCIRVLFLERVARWRTKSGLCGHSVRLQMRRCRAVTLPATVLTSFSFVRLCLNSCFCHDSRFTTLLPCNCLVSMDLCNFMFTRGLCPSVYYAQNKFLHRAEEFLSSRRANSAEVLRCDALCPG
jgi:hypothetical protein